MKRFVDWLKSHGKLFKWIFVVSVLYLVITELASISKTIDFVQLKNYLSDLSIFKIAGLTFLGLFSVSIMLNYDFILNRLLKTDYSKRYIAETSWVTNSLNNILGFGGLISIGLRSGFYGGEKGSKNVVSSLAKILLFAMSGLSICSFLSLLLLVFSPTNPLLHQYGIWLIGGSLYFPMVILVSYFKKTGLLGGLAPKYIRELLLTSFLEWVGVIATFVVIGWAMGVHFTLHEVIPLFVAANIIGIISMIPGELGSLDVILILGLSNLGIPREIIVAWLLLFRIFYYIIPFFIGLFFFGRNLNGRFNTRFGGLPKMLGEEFSHKLLVALLYFSGTLLMLSATIPQALNQFSWLRRIEPIAFHWVTRLPSIIFGFLLIILGRGISARVKKAYPIGLVLVASVVIYTFVRDFSWSMIIFMGILLVFLLFSKGELYRKQLVYSWEMRTTDFLIFGSLMVLYIIIGVYNLPTHLLRHRHPIDFLLFPSEQLWFQGLVAIILVALFSGLVLYYLQSPRHRLGEKLDPDKLQALLDAYGGNTDSQLAFLGDKDLYYYEDETRTPTVVFQFRTYCDKCIIMGNPSGKHADFAKAVEQFVNEADEWGYQLAFYEVTEEYVMLLHDYGYDFIKMGEAAEVDLNKFTFSGKKHKGQRALVNRFERDGYSFAVLEPPYSEATMQTLKTVSDAWLNGRREKGFSLGFYDEDYLKRSPIAVIKSQKGTIVAFANLLPVYDKKTATIDLMRYLPEVASGAMDYLFAKLFADLREKGILYFDLGMAPLSNVGTSRKSFTQERVANLVYSFGDHFYSFTGLREFKDKYANFWIPKYNLYSRDNSLIYTMLQILIIDDNSAQGKVRWPLSRKIIRFFTKKD